VRASRDATGEATPRPWRVGPFYRTDILGPSGEFVAETRPMMTTRSKADADLIVRAVNHHDAMRAFIHDLMAQAASCSDADGVTLAHEYWAERAKALLACVDDCASPSVADAPEKTT